VRELNLSLLPQCPISERLAVPTWDSGGRYGSRVWPLILKRHYKQNTGVFVGANSFAFKELML
jgi:hypothetical protein